MQDDYSIKGIIRNNRRFFIILTILILFTCGLFFNYMYNTQLKSIDNLFDLNYQFLQRYIFQCLDKTILLSRITATDLPALFSLGGNLHSLNVVDYSGTVIQTYPQPNFKYISLANLDIFQKVINSDQVEIEIMPYNLDGEGAALVIAYPDEERVLIATYKFETVLREIANKLKMNLRSDNRGNIILSNIPGGLYSSSHTNIKEGSFFSFYDSVYIISRRIPSISSRVFFIYHIDKLYLKILIFGLLILGIIFLMSWGLVSVTRNFGVIISDMQLLERKSQELIDTIKIDRDSLLKVNDTVKAIDQAGDKLKAETPHSREMQYTFRSYQEMVSELLKLIETISWQNKEIAVMNKAISRSYEEIDRYQQKIMSIIELLSEVDPNTSLEAFLATILGQAISLIPAADAGSAGIKEGDNFRFLAQSGYSDLLTQVEFPGDMLLSSEEPVVFKDVFDQFDQDKPERFKYVFDNIGTENIKSTLVVGLKTKKIIGNMFIDSFDEETRFTDEDKNIMEAIAKVTSLFIYLKLSLNELDSTYIGIIKALAEAVELKDIYTKGHSDRIARYSLMLADKLGFSPERKRILKEAALLHDIGKIGVSDVILNKPGCLTPEEYEQIKLHTIYGGKILQNVDNLHEVAKIVLYHHERWDGRGYPEGLQGEEIPLEARIIALFDAFDTILTARSYKQALPLEYAIKEIRENAGTQFDPNLVEIFLETVSEEWLLTG